jgi:hypothetical protein
MLEFADEEHLLTCCAAKLRVSGALRTLVRVRSSTRIFGRSRRFLDVPDAGIQNAMARSVTKIPRRAVL